MLTSLAGSVELSCKKIEITDKDLWKKSISSVEHYPAHSWEYNYAMSFSMSDKPFLLYYEKETVKACIVLAERSYKGHKDIYTPYGFAGLVGEVSVEVMRSIEKWSKQEGYICAYISQNPFTEANKISQYLVDNGNEVFGLDLKDDIDVIYRNYSSNVKVKIKEVSRSSFDVIVNDNINIDEFYEMYYSTLNRVDAKSLYYFNKETLSHLIDFPKSLVLGIQVENRLIASSIFLFTKDYAEYFIGSSYEEGKQYSAFLIHKSIEILKEQRIKRINLGGGATPKDGLWNFKRRFGGEPLSLKSMNLIFNEAIYELLSKQNDVNPENTNFFPAYYKR